MPIELLDLVKSGGAILAPVFVYLWWYERDERKAGQLKLELLSERTITNVSEFKNLLQTVVDVLGRKTGQK